MPSKLEYVSPDWEKWLPELEQAMQKHKELTDLLEGQKHEIRRIVHCLARDSVIK